jgi:hypothetical protein
MSETIHHIHQHRLDRKHNVLLLFIPGLIFVFVVGMYLVFRLQMNEPLFVTTTSSEAEN